MDAIKELKKVSYRKILVTHDGSILASAAVPQAAYVAITCHAEIILLQVIEPIGLETTYLGPTSMAFNMGTIGVAKVKEDEKLANEQLQRIKNKLEDFGVKSVSTVVRNGFAGAEIVSVAKEQHCDLIVMSTHGRSGFGRMLLGSVVDDVIRHTNYPVLVVHPVR